MLIEIQYPLTSIFIYLSVYLLSLNVDGNPISTSIFIWYFSMLIDIQYLLTLILLCVSGISQC